MKISQVLNVAWTTLLGVTIIASGASVGLLAPVGTAIAIAVLAVFGPFTWAAFALKNTHNSVGAIGVFALIAIAVLLFTVPLLFGMALAPFL